MNKRKDIPTQLSDIPRKEVFGVPEGYFETLQERIEARVAEENTTISKRQQVIRILKPVLSLAASFALVFLLVYYPLKEFLPDYLANQTENQADEQAATSSDDLLFSYLSLSESSAYELFGEEFETPGENVSDEDVIDYLTLALNETEIFAELKN